MRWKWTFKLLKSEVVYIYVCGIGVDTKDSTLEPLDSLEGCAVMAVMSLLLDREMSMKLTQQGMYVLIS